MPYSAAPAWRHRRLLAVTVAIAAGALYLPANLLPFLERTYFGVSRELTVWSGVVELVRSDELWLAAIVFIASIAVPLLKIVGIVGAALASTRVEEQVSIRRLRRIARFLELIGPWSMLDVFILAITVFVIQVGSRVRVEPRTGAAAFAAVVILTLIANQILRSALKTMQPRGEPR